jgi:peptidoglycan biosynthesis protein MviN/MurJ (putative lipid II flippase)
MSLVGALGTLAAPAVLWIRYIGREIWPSTPRAIETQQRLRRTVLYSAAAAGIAALVAQLFEVVVWRSGSGLARPGWALFVIGVAVLFALTTWFALAPRRPKT